jgi:hypothetical protein
LTVGFFLSGVVVEVVEVLVVVVLVEGVEVVDDVVLLGCVEVVALGRVVLDVAGVLPPPPVTPPMTMPETRATMATTTPMPISSLRRRFRVSAGEGVGVTEVASEGDPGPDADVSPLGPSSMRRILEPTRGSPPASNR